MACTKQNGTNELVGKWFHSVTSKDGAREIHWQGQVVGKIDDGHYLVQLYEWLMGEPTEMQIVTLQDMVGWSFYHTSADMNGAYEQRANLKGSL